jgi:hypothetical protein
MGVYMDERFERFLNFCTSLGGRVTVVEDSPFHFQDEARCSLKEFSVNDVRKVVNFLQENEDLFDLFPIYAFYQPHGLHLRITFPGEVLKRAEGVYIRDSTFKYGISMAKAYPAPPSVAKEVRNFLPPSCTVGAISPVKLLLRCTDKVGWDEVLTEGIDRVVEKFVKAEGVIEPKTFRKVGRRVLVED